ncbi:MAG: TlpA disulfide reductase family protein [Mycobacteriales bacterium]
MRRLFRLSAPARFACAGLAAAVLSGCAGTNAVSNGTSGPLLRTLADGSSNRLLSVPDRIPAPTLRGESLDGGPLDLAAYRGKVVVLNFWASWCPPCRAESADLIAVAHSAGRLGVVFLGVNIKDDRGAARRFDQVHGVPYPSIFDQPGVVLTRLHALVPQEPPSTLLVDRAGRIAELFTGGVTTNELAGPVQQLAAETA